MARAGDEAKVLFPFLVALLEEGGFFGGGGSGGGSTGTVDLSDYLRADGTVRLEGNWAVRAGVTIDGEDISALGSSYRAHLTGDYHPRYAEAEGGTNRPAAYANRLNKSVVAGAGITVTPGGNLTQNQTVAANFGSPTPLMVSLAAAAPGVSNNPARSDHRHPLDTSIAPTWSGIHTFNQRAIFSAGLRTAAGQTVELGSNAATLYADGITPGLVQSGANWRIGGLLGVGTAPLYRVHIKAGVANETLLVLEDASLGSQMVFDAGTAYNGVTGVPRVGSNTYASETTGWRVDNEGGADFRYIFADEMHVRAFIADIERALAGGQIITKSVAILSRDFTVPATGLVTSKLYVYDLPGFPNTQVYAPGDYIRVRTVDRSGGGLAILDAWGVVTNYQDNAAYAGPEGEQRWDWETLYYTTSAVVGKKAPKDGLALDYGHPSTGGGYIESLATGLFTPYIQVVTWVTNPWLSANRTVQGRYGNLNGITDINLNPTGYGFYTKNGYLDGTIYARQGRILNNVIIGGGSMTAQNVAGWGWGADTTYIDGGRLFTGTVNTSKLNVGVGGGNLIDGANWNDDPTGGALVMPGGWERNGYGTVTTHKLEKDTSGTITGVAGENYITATVGASSGTYIRTAGDTGKIYVDTSRQYMLSAYARRTSGTGSVTIGVECYNSSDSLLGYRYPALDHGSGTGTAGLLAVQYRYSGVIGGTGSNNSNFFAGTHYIRVFIWCAESSSGSTTANIWQVQFEEGDLLTSWAPGLRGNVQIDSNKILIGTPGGIRIEETAEGIKSYGTGGVLSTHLDSADGFFKWGAGVGTANQNGLRVETTNSYTDVRSYSFWSSGVLQGSLQGYSDTGVNKQRWYSPSIASKDSELWAEAYAPSSKQALLDFRANYNAGAKVARFYAYANSADREAGVQADNFNVSNNAIVAGAMVVGVGTMPAGGSIKASGDIIVSGTLSTDGGSTTLDVGAYTAAADAVSTGYITVVHNGTSRRLMVRTA